MSQVKLTADSGGGTTSLKAPSSTTSDADVVLKLPVADGSANQVLKTDGSGQLSFTSNAGTTINNNADNRVITGSGTASTLNGEANLTWDATTLKAEAANPVLELSGTAGTSGNTFMHINANANHWCIGADNYSSQNLFVIKDGTPASSTHRFAIDSSGFVGIGETSPSSYDAGARTLVISQGSTLAGMTIRASQQGSIYFADGTSGNEPYRGRIEYVHADDALTFGTAATERMRILSNGDIGIGTSTINRSSSGRSHIQFDYSGSDGSEGVEIRLSNSAINGNNATDNAAISYIAQDFNLVNRESGNMRFFTSNSERMRIDSSGKVGIGTTSPISILHLHEAGASGSPIIQFSNGDTGATSGDGFAIGVADNESPFIYNRENTALRFAINNTERMRLRATTGGLMIAEDGTNRIGEPKLHIKHGGASQNLASFYFDSADDRAALLIRHQRASGSTFASMIAFLDSSGNVVGAINSNGNNTTNFVTSSDYRLKENNVAISDGITRLKTLKPYRFNFKDTPAITVDGFFAHEVTAVPEAITGTKDEIENVFYRDDDEIPEGKNVGDVKETVPKYQGIDQAKLVPLLTAALQEEVAKREALEARVAALEAA